MPQHTLGDRAISQISDTIRRVRSLRPSDRAHGLTYVPPRRGGYYPVPVIVTGGDSLTGYTVSVYGNGYSQPATGSGLLDALNIAYADAVPTGLKLWVLPTQLGIVGDGT